MSPACGDPSAAIRGPYPRPDRARIPRPKFSSPHAEEPGIPRCYARAGARLNEPNVVPGVGPDFGINLISVAFTRLPDFFVGTCPGAPVPRRRPSVCSHVVIRRCVETGSLLGLSPGKDPRRLHPHADCVVPAACAGGSCPKEKAGAIQALAYRKYRHIPAEPSSILAGIRVRYSAALANGMASVGLAVLNRRRTWPGGSTST